VSDLEEYEPSEITVNHIVETCLSQLGYFYINEETKHGISEGLSDKYNNPENDIPRVATDAIRLIVSSKEFQMA
jgi:hypothetical protein